VRVYQFRHTRVLEAMPPLQRTPYKFTARFVNYPGAGFLSSARLPVSPQGQGGRIIAGQRSWSTALTRRFTGRLAARIALIAEK
jgi:hypothetical protein